MTEKIIKLQQSFGMKGNKVAELMGISYQSFKNKKSEKFTGDRFSEKNYLDFKENLKKLFENNLRITKK